MADRMIDPFKHIGQPESWGKFGTDPHDVAADAERRAMIDFMARRLRKAEKLNNDEIVVSLLSGGFVAFASLFISAGGGVDRLADDAFDKWIGIATFAWFQALSTGTDGGIQ